MSLFRPSREVRASPGINNLPWNAGGTMRSLGGSMTASLQLIPLYSAVSLIADAVSTAPVHAFRDAEHGKALIPAQPPVVVTPGVGKLPRSAWVGQAVMSLLMRGNAYGFNLELGQHGLPVKVKWLNPDGVHVDEAGPLPRYFVGGKEVPADLITHIPGIVLPGSCVGLSPIGLFRKQIETGLRVDGFAHDWYGDTAAPRGILSNKSRTLTADEVQVAKARFKESVADHDIMVTGNDWGWTPLAPTPADAQFIQASQMSANQIAAVYHVPPEDIGGVASSSMTYSTLEMNMIRFNQRAVLPWTSRIERGWSDLLPNPQYVRFNLDHAARTDLKTRMEAYGLALDHGIQTLDEVRALEDSAPLTDAEKLFWQENFQNFKKTAAAVATPDDPTAAPTPAADPKGKK